jgi:hypothetical protein
MARGTRLVLLCEDLQQEVFARHYFMSRGFDRREIRSRIGLSGQGAGEQFVRENYPQEVKAYRSRSAYQAICLVIVIDADVLTVTQRVEQLDQALQGSQQHRRQIGEKIAVFVPKRNIETWIHFLRGEVVDEVTVYSKLAQEGECKQDVRRLARDICPAGVPSEAPLSLHAACEEVARILP